jgi:hypothetical protein
MVSPGLSLAVRYERFLLNYHVERKMNCGGSTKRPGYIAE